jgi:hypothetical protein
MNYELAKQLQDAGFPIESIVISAHSIGAKAYGLVPPKLTDLLSALSDYPIKLMVGMKEGCSATVWEKGLSAVDWYPTPEEAVARLWLEIDGINKWNEQQKKKVLRVSEDEMDEAIERYNTAKENGTLDRDFPKL